MSIIQRLERALGRDKIDPRIKVLVKQMSEDYGGFEELVEVGNMTISLAKQTVTKLKRLPQHR